MQFQIPIDTLFTQVFGLAAPLLRKADYKTNTVQTADSVDVRYSIPNITPIDETGFKSSLGTPVQFPMWLKEGNYNVMAGGEILRESFGGALLPWTSVASFSRAKRNTKTYMSSQKTVVIEQYGFEPWNIKIQGFIIKGNDQQKRSVPDQVMELQRYEEVCDAIEVGGSVFEWLKINHVSIDKISYPAARNLNMDVCKPFEIDLISIEPIELVLL